jgi:S-adenosylhomocysteine hydrolase
VHDIPVEQDQDIAKPKLATLCHKNGKLTPEWIAYMNDYSAGT